MQAQSMPPRSVFIELTWFRKALTSSAKSWTLFFKSSLSHSSFSMRATNAVSSGGADGGTFIGGMLEAEVECAAACVPGSCGGTGLAVGLAWTPEAWMPAAGLGGGAGGAGCGDEGGVLRGGGGG